MEKLADISRFEQLGNCGFVSTINGIRGDFFGGSDPLGGPTGNIKKKIINNLFQAHNELKNLLYENNKNAIDEDMSQFGMACMGYLKVIEQQIAVITGYRRNPQ